MNEILCVFGLVIGHICYFETVDQFIRQTRDLNS